MWSTTDYYGAWLSVCQPLEMFSGHVSKENSCAVTSFLQITSEISMAWISMPLHISFHRSLLGETWKRWIAAKKKKRRAFLGHSSILESPLTSSPGSSHSRQPCAWCRPAKLLLDSECPCCGLFSSLEMPLTEESLVSFIHLRKKLFLSWWKTASESASYILCVQQHESRKLPRTCNFLFLKRKQESTEQLEASKFSHLFLLLEASWWLPD